MAGQHPDAPLDDAVDDARPLGGLDALSRLFGRCRRWGGLRQRRLSVARDRHRRGGHPVGRAGPQIARGSLIDLVEQSRTVGIQRDDELSQGHRLGQEPLLGEDVHGLNVGSLGVTQAPCPLQSIAQTLWPPRFLRLVPLELTEDGKHIAGPILVDGLVQLLTKLVASFVDDSTRRREAA